MPAHCATPTHLLYLHGFRSSPQSMKAVKLRQWLAQHRPDLVFWCPQLPPSPQQALALLLDGVAGWPAERSVVVGSSLGGFYAAVVAERLGWPSLAINPAVHAERDLARHIGEHAQWHSPEDRFFFRPEFIDELSAMKPPVLTRLERHTVLMATGDEVLDWRDMQARYQGAHQHIVAGSDHALSDFDDHLPFILDVLQLS